MKIRDIFNGEENKAKKTLEDFRKPDIEELGEIEQTEDLSEVNDDAQGIVEETKSKTNDFFLQGGEIEPKWIKICIKTWSAVMSFVWFFVSCLTYSPILFISDRIDAVIKNKKKSLLISTIIHFILLTLIITLLFVRRSPTVE